MYIVEGVKNMGSFNKNKEIVGVCKYYYDIVNYEIYEDDKIKQNIINLYIEYIFSFDIVTKREKEKLEQIDKIVYKFLTDKRFNKEMIRELSHLRVSKAVSNVVEYVMNKMIEYFENYKTVYTRNIYIPRWI